MFYFIDMQREKILEKLLSSKKIVFFTGAGISAESGIPTFRGEGGLWKKFKPEELANFNAFIKNPELVWEWYQYRRKIVKNAEPNLGHKTIALMQKYFDVTVVTQNVDNLHIRAGSNLVHELHGNIEKNYCIKCKKRYDYVDFNDDDKISKCECGGLIRPDVVWFGEMLPQVQFSNSENAAKNCDMIFVVGTSFLVYPAADIPIKAKISGKFLVEINLEETELTRFADVSLFGSAGIILPQLLIEFEKIKLNV